MKRFLQTAVLWCALFGASSASAQSFTPLCQLSTGSFDRCVGTMLLSLLPVLDAAHLPTDIAALAGFGAGTGIPARTGSGTWALRQLVAPAAGLSISFANGVGGNPTLSLANDLAALEGLSSTGLAVRTGTDAWTVRTLTGPAAGISVSNGSGVAGNPTLALANDLAALEGLSSTGLAVRTGTDAWTVRTLTGPAAGISVSNGSGVAGDPTLALANDLAAVEGLGSTGIAVRTAADTWAVRTLVQGAGITITNPDGTGGNITIAAAASTAPIAVACGHAANISNVTFSLVGPGSGAGLFVAPRAGNSAAFRCSIVAGPTPAGFAQFSYHKNGGAAVATCSLGNGSTTTCGTATTTSLAIGDWLEMKGDGLGTSYATTKVTCCIEVTP